MPPEPIETACRASPSPCAVPRPKTRRSPAPGRAVSRRRRTSRTGRARRRRPPLPLRRSPCPVPPPFSVAIRCSPCSGTVTSSASPQCASRPATSTSRAACTRRRTRRRCAAKWPSLRRSVSAPSASVEGKRSERARTAMTASSSGFGHHDIADAQAGEEHFREGAEIGDAARAIHALQRGERRAGIAELAVVIVLDDPGIVAPRPVEQGEAAAHRHRHAERILMRGRDIGGACALGRDARRSRDRALRHRPARRRSWRRCRPARHAPSDSRGFRSTRRRRAGWRRAPEGPAPAACPRSARSGRHRSARRARFADRWRSRCAVPMPPRGSP